MNKLNAYGKKVIVERQKSAEKVGSILVPNQKKLSIGKVISVGTEIEHVTEGDTIYFAPYSGFDVEVDGKEFTIIIDNDILAVTQ